MVDYDKNYVISFLEHFNVIFANFEVLIYSGTCQKTVLELWDILLGNLLWYRFNTQHSFQSPRFLLSDYSHIIILVLNPQNIITARFTISSSSLAGPVLLPPA